MGDRTPWRTWYCPLYSRLRSMATTSLGSATTQTVEGWESNYYFKLKAFEKNYSKNLYSQSQTTV